ncbi:MAG: DsbA family protein [Magnetococcus sp. DMHC-6]
MTTPQNRHPLLIVLLVTGFTISASMLFLGWQILEQRTQPPPVAQIDEALLATKIREGINNYIKDQNKAQQKAQAEQEKAMNEKAKGVRKVDFNRDHVFGNPGAEVTLIEYSDFECPFCKKFHPIPEEIVSQYKGRVNWVFRHFPLSFHGQSAQKEAEASECAAEQKGNDGFWEYAKLIYDNTATNGKEFSQEKLFTWAKEAGLDEKQFQTCLQSGKMAIRVQEDIDEAKQIGITGTPASILLVQKTGQVRFISGALPLKAFEAIIELLLKGGA